MSAPFRFVMISAMYENGGNTTQRLLDGHPELFSYPYESQPGTKYVLDHLTSMFPVKYRWPVFPLNASVEADYETIIDEECKVRIKTPQSSKFRDTPIGLDDKERKARLDIAESLVKKLLHLPMTALRDDDPDDAVSLVQALQRLFSLSPVAAVPASEEAPAGSEANVDKKATGS